eukprot:TRINITY_DN8784_c0_g1_i1.p1 TRINITY_DN8784_c0_g1~~TRINITY_DN8784_c0_g1_i1.p1  ORF type:complete len:234 (+),score=38.50 TRINITY_DN8784_c0_g1_i1:2-703(+)
MPPHPFTDAHRFFMQVLLDRPILSDRDLKETYQLVQRQWPDDAKEWEDFRRVLNEGLSPLSLELRNSLFTEGDGQMYWGLVNTSPDEQATRAADLNENERKYFKRLLIILATESEGMGTIGFQDALLVSRSADVNLKVDAVEALLGRLVQNQWLRSHENRLSVGIRAWLELRPFFEDLGLETCEACQQVVLSGHSCPHPPCRAAFHTWCENARYRDQPAERRRCPLCGKSWNA